LRDEALPVDIIPVPLHPDIQMEIVSKHKVLSPSAGKYLEVIPTASGRTVLRRDNEVEPYFIKLHYPRRIGRFTRNLPLYKWLSSLENSSELLANIATFPSCLALLAETSGTFVEGTGGAPGFGVLYREFSPRPSKGERLLIPAFSLFSRSKPQAGSESLLLQLLTYLGKTTDSFISYFIRPLLDSYIYLSCVCGMIPEYNAQNVLYEIDLNNRETRCVVRDMSDFFKDITIRRERGLHTSFCTYHKIERSIDPDFFKRRSFAYDFKCGEYLIRPLCECYAREMNISLEELIESVRGEARLAWSLCDNYFQPEDKWYVYPKEAYVDRGSYVEMATPAFR
jgi:hypothetical protein